MLQKNESSEESYRTQLNKSILLDNAVRGRILASVVIALECMLILISVISLLAAPDNRFYYYNYIAMYLLMVFMNVVFLVYTGHYRSFAGKTDAQIKRLGIFLVGYITFNMCWGAVVTLMDQELYGQIMAYMINMIICSAVYVLDVKRALIPYVLSLGIVAAGLPLVQPSSDILVGHYVNVLIFALISWFISRLNYLYYCKNHMHKSLLQSTNELLENQIAKNAVVNRKLREANMQLKKMSLVDELTGIPNRRSFYEDIQKLLDAQSGKEILFSAVMIDIDFFKQFNDNYGHSEGDAILKLVAGQITSCLKHSFDFTVRWGGEEFVYAAFYTDEREIVAIAEKMRDQILSLNVPHEFSRVCPCLTASFGTSTQMVRTIKDVENCIERADRALYLAKAGGRNRVIKFGV